LPPSQQATVKSHSHESNLPSTCAMHHTLSRGCASLGDVLAYALQPIPTMNSQDNRADTDAGLQRDPDEWKTGDEAMTAAQRSYLETLSREAGETFDDSLSKAEASKRIDELRQRSPRIAGTDAGDGEKAPRA
jgi:hypothetical protein